MAESSFTAANRAFTYTDHNGDTVYNIPLEDLTSRDGQWHITIPDTIYVPNTISASGDSLNTSRSNDTRIDRQSSNLQNTYTPSVHTDRVTQVAEEESNVGIAQPILGPDQVQVPQATTEAAAITTTPLSGEESRTSRREYKPLIWRLKFKRPERVSEADYGEYNDNLTFCYTNLISVHILIISFIGISLSIEGYIKYRQSGHATGNGNGDQVGIQTPDGMPTNTGTFTSPTHGNQAPGPGQEDDDECYKWEKGCKT